MQCQTETERRRWDIVGLTAGQGARSDGRCGIQRPFRRRRRLRSGSRRRLRSCRLLRLVQGIRRFCYNFSAAGGQRGDQNRQFLFYGDAPYCCLMIVEKAMRICSVPSAYAVEIVPPIFSVKSLAMDSPSPVASRAVATV